MLLVKNGELTDEVGSKLSSYFEPAKFVEHGEQTKDRWLKIKVAFCNFLSKYKELKPSQNISGLSVE